MTDASGHVVGSSLIGQDFTKPVYFHPRPEADDYASGPRLQLRVELRSDQPGSHRQRTRGLHHRPDNPYATPRPVLRAGAGRRQGRQPGQRRTATPCTKNADGTYVCDPDTVPERVIAYRAENGLGADVTVPVDAVTASGQRARPGHLGRQRDAPGKACRRRPKGVRRGGPRLIRANTDERPAGFLGEPAVNVLRLNLALDRLAPS